MNTENIPMTAPVLVPWPEWERRASLLEAAHAHIMNPRFVVEKLELLVGDKMMTRGQIADALLVEVERIRADESPGAAAVVGFETAEETMNAVVMEATREDLSPAARLQAAQSLLLHRITASPVLAEMERLAAETQKTPSARLAAILNLYDDAHQANHTDSAPGDIATDEEDRVLLALLIECFGVLQIVTLGQCRTAGIALDLFARVEEAVRWKA